MKKRIFILSEKEVHIKNILTLFQIGAYEKDKNLEELFDIKTFNKIYDKLPEDYDVYLLHISDVEIEQIKELRETRPSAWIYSLTNPWINTHRVSGLVDRALNDRRDETDFKYILHEIKDYSKEDKK